MNDSSNPPKLGAQTSGEAFWEAHYRDRSGTPSGRPSAALVHFVADRTPGTALDLGCSRGDDLLWLARSGWSATGVDVAPTALAHARENLARAGLSDRVSLQCHDLSRSFPEGGFDLVSALFLLSPVEFPRCAVLRRAAGHVRPGGLFLVVTHGSHAPWSWADPARPLPTATEELQQLQLDLTHWRQLFVGSLPRVGHGPGGQTAEVIDTVVALERQSPGVPK